MNNELEPERGGGGMSWGTWLKLIASVIVLGVVATVLIYGHATIQAMSSPLTVVIAGICVLALLAALVIGTLFALGEIENRSIKAGFKSATANGYYPVFFDKKSKKFIQAENGELPQAVPQSLTYSPHQQNDGHITKIIEELVRNQLQQQQQQQPPQLLASPQQPSQEYLLSKLDENSLTVSPGVRRGNGEIVRVSIEAVPHLKIIGASGFGKSCLAGALLDQATQLNSPDMLQIALLDLEHKTSRLYENLEHVAQVKVGSRLVDMVATNADEVAQHLRILVKSELDWRTSLSEAELARVPVLLMYLEEMLSLQYEVDPALLNKMFADLTILSVRGRKYKMFLMACMQTDYSTDELKVSQKMFRFRGAAAIDTSAAKAAGFMNTELIKENFSKGQPGQFVVEFPSFSDIVYAPAYDVKRLLSPARARFQPSFTRVSEALEMPVFQNFQDVKTPRSALEENLKNRDEIMWQAKVDTVRDLRFSKHWGKVAIVEKVWRVKAGATQGYKNACAEYEQIISELELEGGDDDDE